MKLACFYHIGVFDINITQSIVDSQLDNINKSGLLNILSHKKIFYTKVGKDKNKLCLPTYCECVYENFDPSEYEIPTLDKLHDYCIENPDAYVLYIHSKGATAKFCKQHNFQKEWRKIMDYWCVWRHQDCLDFLRKGLFTVGCLMSINHYVGNFWWGRADYIKTKNKAPRYFKYWKGYWGEYWVMNPPLKGKHISLYDHYLQFNSTPSCNGLYGNTITYENYIIKKPRHNGDFFPLTKLLTQFVFITYKKNIIIISFVISFLSILLLYIIYKVYSKRKYDNRFFKVS